MKKMRFTTQQGLIADLTLLDRNGRFLVGAILVALSGFCIPVVADDEPDPFANNKLKGDPKAVKPMADAPVDLLGAVQAMAKAQIGIQEDAIPKKAKKKGDKDGKKKEKKGKQDSVQIKVSKMLDKMAVGERQKRSSFMGVVIEDVALLSGLDEAQKKRLELAAKGATERSMESWYDQMDRYVQQRTKGATAKTIDKLLASVGNVSFGGSSKTTGEDNDLWKESLKKVLTDEQSKTYEEVTAERKRYAYKAFSMMVMTTLDEYLRLTPDQHAKLSPLVEASTAENYEEIRVYWNGYFEKTMMLSMLAGADEKKVKAILTEKQFERWETGSANFNHFWDQQLRKKKAEQEAKKKAARAVRKKAEPKEKKEKKADEIPNTPEGKIKSL